MFLFYACTSRKMVILPITIRTMYRLKICLYLLLFFTTTTHQLEAQYAHTWSYAMGGTSGSAQDPEMAVDKTGNVYITGNFASNVDFDGTAGTSSFNSTTGRMFLVKYDAAGHFLWAKNFGDNTGSLPLAIAIDGQGNVYITGYYTGTCDFDPSAGTMIPPATMDRNLFLAKYNSSGNLLWLNYFDAPGSQYAHDLVVDRYNNVYLGGAYEQSVDFDPSSATAILNTAHCNAFLAKYASSGSLIWVKDFVSSEESTVFSIALDKNEHPVLTGRFTDSVDIDPGAGHYWIESNGFYDFFVARYDDYGNFKNGGSTGSPDYDNATDIVVNSLGNVYIAGSFSGSCDFNLGTGTHLLTNLAYDDGFVAKFDSTFALQWAYRLASDGWDSGDDMTLDSYENLLVTGSFNPYVSDFIYENLSGSDTIEHDAGSDGFILRYAPDGEVTWQKKLGDTGLHQQPRIVITNSDHFYLTGYFTDVLDFEDASLAAPASWNTLYLAKFATVPVSGINNQLYQDHEMRLFPNPAGDYITCYVEGENVELTIFNEQGVPVKKDIGNSTVIDCSALAPGLYFIQATGISGTHQGKFMVVR